MVRAKTLVAASCSSLLVGLLACASEEPSPLRAADPQPSPAQTGPTATAAPAKAHGASLASIEVPVEGMTCEGCESSINSAIKSVDGVVSCNASHTDKVARIQYDPSKVKPEVLAQTISDLGYKASLQ